MKAIRGLVMTDSCVSHFKNLNILTVPCLYIFEIAMYIKTNPQLFKTNSEVFTRNSRHPQNLFPVSANTALMRKSVFCLASKIYNKLPINFRMLPLNQFKHKLLTFLIENCFYSISEFLLYKFNNSI